jgi:hypothetical protein
MNKFLTSVADAYFYNSTGTLLFQGKTNLDDSVTTTVAKTDIRGGKGNQLLTTYYHTSAMAVKITDTQWNLNMLAATTGSSVNTNTSVYTEETVAVVAGAGTLAVTSTPLTVQGGLYGWVQLPDKDSTGATLTTTSQKITFVSTRLFTLPSPNAGYTGNVCVRYYATNAAATYLQIPANIIPATGRLVLDAQLVTGSASSTSVIGKAEFIFPAFQLDGAFAINMTSAGVSTTPVAGNALADTSLNSGACTDVPLYCQVTEVLNSTNWYDNVFSIAIAGGDFSIAHASTSGYTLSVYALAPQTNPFMPPVGDLTFSSGTTGTVTIGTNTGVLTYVGTGTSLLHVYITGKTTIEDSCIVTVTA